MTDHETFVLLAAKQLSEPLSSEEEAELDGASCRAAGNADRQLRACDGTTSGCRPSWALHRFRHAFALACSMRPRADGASTGASFSASRRSFCSASSASRSSPADEPKPRHRRPQWPIVPSLLRRHRASSCVLPLQLRARWCLLRRRNPRRMLPGRTCTGHALRVAIPSPPISRRVNRQVSGRESALPTGPGTHMPGQSRAS